MEPKQSSSCVKCPLSIYRVYTRTGHLLHLILSALVSSLFAYGAISEKSLSDSCLRGRTLYYNLRHGFGSTPKCDKLFQSKYLCPGPQMAVFCDDFCWLWTTEKHWGGIDSTDAKSNMALESVYVWPTALFCMVAASMFSMLSVLFFSVMMCKERKSLRRMAAMNHRVLVPARPLHGNNTRKEGACTVISTSPALMGVLTSLMAFWSSFFVLLVACFADTLNPAMWEQFYADISGDEEGSPCAGQIEIGLTRGGWAWLMGCAMSFVLWFGYLFVWVGLPKQCLMKIPRHSYGRRVPPLHDRLLGDMEDGEEGTGRVNVVVKSRCNESGVEMEEAAAKINSIYNDMVPPLKAAADIVQVEPFALCPEMDKNKIDSKYDEVESSEVETMV